MAAFDYRGFAEITWQTGEITTQYIEYVLGTLMVWPEGDVVADCQYVGSMNEHPARRIKFLHN